MNLHQHVELLRQIGLADLRPGIQFHLQRRNLALATHRQPNLILAGRSYRSARPAAVFPKVVTGNAMRFFIAQIPHQAIQASFRLDLLFRLLVVRIGGFVELLGFGTRILADQLSGSIEDFQLRFCPGFRRILQVEINHRARGRILSRLLRRMGLLTTSTLPSLNTVRRPRCVKMNILVRHVVTELP